jgi:CHAT domain-containing protein
MHPSATLVGMLISFPLLLFPPDARGSNPGGKDAPAKLAEHKRRESVRPAEGARAKVALRRIAETKAAVAAARQRKQTGKDLAAAITLFKESARLFRAGHWDVQGADVDLQIGELYFTSSKYNEALGFYREALNLAGSDGERRCRALSHIARTYATTGRISEAKNYAQQALSLSEGLVNERTQGEALEAYGEALYWSGDSLQAVEPLGRARDLFAEVRDADGQALAVLMLGEASYKTDRLESLRLAERAAQLWSEAGNAYGVAQARAFLVTLSALEGQYETARCNAEEALPVFQETNDWDSAATILTSLGFISMETGDAEKSLEYYQKARAVFANAHDWLGEAEAITGVGAASLAMGRHTQLLQLYEVKLDLGHKTGNPNLTASALADIAGVYELRHQYSKAETLYHRSLAGYRLAHNPLGEGKFLIHLAHLYTQEKKYSEAISLLENARPLKEKSGQVEELARLDYELADVYRRQGRLEDALKAIQRTIDIIESQRLNVGAFDSRASYFASVHQYYALYVQVLMRLHRQDPYLHSAARAFEASERSKMRSLLDWLAGASQGAVCDELLKKQAEIEHSAPSRFPDSKAAPTSAVTPSLTLDEVQAEIADDDAILLEYALGDEKSYLWAVGREQVLSYDLPEDRRLNELTRGFRNAVMARQPRLGESNLQYVRRVSAADERYRHYARELSRLLLGPVQLGRAKRIIIVPDGPLQYLPFSALSIRDATGERAIVADHEIIVLPSASALGAVRKAVANRPRPVAGAAVFADPVFERDDPRVPRHSTAPKAEQWKKQPSAGMAVWRDVQPGSRYIPSLPGSRDEADAVLQSLGPQGVFVARGFLASRETVLTHDLGSYRVIHFATHGILDEKHPERSGLILSLIDKQGKAQDGYLRLNEIYNLKLSADLVVLSSCDSALGKDLSSEGIIGLPRAFLRAGAKSVIATLWKVDDRATAELMVHFYSRLHQGESPASALRNSQRDLSRNSQWHHPYFWAAFIFQGDYRLAD